MSQAIFKNPFVSSAPVLTGFGNGTLTIDRLTHFTINQSYTVICTAVAPFTVFQVVASLDGPIGVAVVGTQFYDEDLKVFFTIQQGPTLFAIGDKFEFGVTQGTDLNNENIDTYDELPQKNFSEGIDGTNSGNDNLRFNDTTLVAKMILQDLEFTSLLAEELGNFIQVEYVPAVDDVESFLAVGDILYEALTPGPAGDAISIEYEDWTPPVFATVGIGGTDGVSFVAANAGAAGNDISISYLDGAPSSTPIITILMDSITIQIQSATTTAQQIITEVNNHFQASAMVVAGAIGNPAAPQSAPVMAQNLVGGADAIGDAGSEVVSVVGNAIKVKLRSAISTAAQVKAAVDGFPSASALVTATIQGSAGNGQTAPFAQTNLADGQIGNYPPGSELVEVIGTKIRVTFQSLASTAQQIKDAIEANSEANALVSIAIAGNASDPQSAPSKRFLSGGSPTDTFAFNVDEILSPQNFYEGSGNLMVSKLIAQGFAKFRGKVTMRDILELDDLNSEENRSGLAISNVQRAINQILSQLQITAISGTTKARVSGVDVELLDGRLLSQEMSKKILDFEGAIIDFATGDVFASDGTTPIDSSFTPQVVANGLWQWYSVAFLPDVFTSDNRITVKVNVVAASGQGVTPAASPKANFIGARPIGEVVVQGTGSGIANLTNANIRQLFPGGGGGGGIGFQEVPVGLVNGVNAIFTLSKIPTDDNSIIVVVNGMIVPRSAYTVVGAVITFVSQWIPATCQEVYCWYLTEGSPSAPILPSGDEVVEYRTITLAEASAKQLILIGVPGNPARVKLDVIGGCAQEFGVDFSVVGNVVEWTGLGLDQIPTEQGDKFRIAYFT